MGDARVLWSDFYHSAAELRKQPLFAEFYSQHGDARGMHASLPALPVCPG